MLSQAAFLRALVAGVGGDVIDLGAGTFLREKIVLDHGADDASGAFGAQRHRVAAAVFKGEGFLVDYVGRLADAAVEEVGMLKDWRANFLEVIELRNFA